MVSSERHFEQALQAVTFGSAGSLEASEQDTLEQLRAGLPPLPANLAGAVAKTLLESLQERAEAVERGLRPFLERFRGRLAAKNLEVPHSFEILFAHTHLLDALHRLAFAIASEELPALIRLQVLNVEKELRFKKKLLPKKLEALKVAGAQPSAVANDTAISATERSYYERLEGEMRQEVDETRLRIGQLEAELPVWAAFRAEREVVEGRLVLFARGGYGRAEMSFGSDVDTGWCLETEGMAPGEEAVFQEAIMRTERLLKLAGVETAHQYFETGEDLSRFTEPENLHTIPSVLEGRVVLGNPRTLGKLKEKFFQVLPYEEFLNNKIGEYRAQKKPSLTDMDLKEDAGGLRTIQIPLWILGVTQRAESFMTADLLRLAHRLGFLSVGQGLRLLRALELLYELRNFSALAELHYYDGEAKAENFGMKGFPQNRINDGLARLYLFRKRRFPSLDRFDSIRLRLASDVRGIAASLTGKILDRWTTHSLEGFGVSVHLGTKKITHILDNNGKKSDAPAAVLENGKKILSLFAFIARTDYDLSEELKDGLGEAVAGLEIPEEGLDRAPLALLLNEIVGAPFAHRALETMFEVSDSLAPAMDTLLGRFIPDFDSMFFLVRDPKVAAGPFHRYLLDCVENGQRSLGWLAGKYPELHVLLNRKEILALKWALLLHGLGRLEGTGEDTSRTAEKAAEVLARAGHNDDSLEELLRLLIQHHQTMVRLSRTATYFDQALVEFFDIAGRDIVRVILLFLVNRSVLSAGPYSSRGDLANLERFFAETERILAEVRGFSEKSRSLELINEYLYRKKEQIRSETRLHQLLQKAITFGMERTVYAPLRGEESTVWNRVEKNKKELEALHRDLVWGAGEGSEHEHLSAKLATQLRNTLGQEAVARLTGEEEEAFSWFFSAFPNRYLLSTPPRELAAQIARFSGFRKEVVRAEVVLGPSGAEEGLLIYTRGLDHSHSRVAHMLSRMRLNLVSGKINPIRLSEQEQAYCYFFQITPPTPERRLFARELEQMILMETPPELRFEGAVARYGNRGTRVEFLGDDGKGYLVAGKGGVFERHAAHYGLVRVVLQDEPYLFFKVIRAFESYGVEIVQSLITTIGNQVVDYFYVLPEVYDELRLSTFEERLATLMRAELA